MENYSTSGLFEYCALMVSSGILGPFVLDLGYKGFLQVLKKIEGLDITIPSPILFDLFKTDSKDEKKEKLQDELEKVIVGESYMLNNKFPCNPIKY